MRRLLRPLTKLFANTDLPLHKQFKVNIGVAAALRQDERSLGGFCVMELFLSPDVQGRGWAPRLQRALIEALPARPGDCLHGTIHGLNRPSLRTALRCGREVVETWWFRSLEPGR